MGWWADVQMWPTVAHLEQLLTAQVNHALTVITVQCENQECRGEGGGVALLQGKRKS